MSEERKAGELILLQLEMFNEAVVLFENVIAPALFEGIDGCVESFAHENDWGGKYELGSALDNWLAPKDWISNQGEEDPDFKAWFVIDTINQDGDYWATLFCGMGSQGGQAGFVFRVDPKKFGGKVAWHNYARRIPEELVRKLVEVGFQNMDKGEFFLPIRLDNKLLAQSWLEYGEFTKDDDSFVPLCEALEKLKQAAPIFDQIMLGCTSTNPAIQQITQE